MNQPPNWKELAERITEQDASDFRVLIVTNSLLVINEVVMPAMAKGFPKATYNYARRQFTLPKGTLVYLQSVASEAGIDALRGLEFDCIFFDPCWQGTAAEMELINAQNRRPRRKAHANRTT
jgi:hypothetical protein